MLAHAACHCTSICNSIPNLLNTIAEALTAYAGLQRDVVIRPCLLPGLIAASVWMTPWMGRPVLPELISRPVPLMTPGARRPTSKMDIRWRQEAPRLCLELDSTCSRARQRAVTACQGSRVQG